MGIQIGDVLHIKPNFYCEYGMKDQIKPMVCRVVYVHPEGRYYVVEFISDNGETWREAFYPYTRRIGDIQDSSAPKLPDERTIT